MAELHVGDLAPDFTLPADDGSNVTLSELRGKRVILFFYPKDDTPGCTAQACNFRDAFPLIEEKNGIVLGISGDDVNSHKAFRTKYDLPYQLLADTDLQVIRLYNAWGPKVIRDVPTEGIIRSHYVIDETGHIADIQRAVDHNESANLAVAIL